MKRRLVIVAGLALMLLLLARGQKDNGTSYEEKKISWRTAGQPLAAGERVFELEWQKKVAGKLRVAVKPAQAQPQVQASAGERVKIKAM